MRLVPPLLALAIGTFGIGTTEFAPMGLLPGIARSLDVSIPTAGQLVTAYAIGVMVGAPLMTLLLARLRRRTALLALLAVFTLGNLCSALAPGYDSLLAARVLTALAHGAFFGLGSVEAASLVAPDRRASAVATMLMGLTIANVGGVPAATFLGHLIGWRPAFLLFGIVSALLTAIVFMVTDETKTTSENIRMMAGGFGGKPERALERGKGVEDCNSTESGEVTPSATTMPCEQPPVFPLRPPEQAAGGPAVKRTSLAFVEDWPFQRQHAGQQEPEEPQRPKSSMSKKGATPQKRKSRLSTM